MSTGLKVIPKALSKASSKGLHKTLSPAPPSMGVKAGCPLEDHEKWELIYTHNGNPSEFCWDDYGRTIIFNDCPAGLRLLAFNKMFGTGAVLTGRYEPNIVGYENWTLPFAKFIDDQNLVGFRLNRHDSDDSLQLQVVQRLAGTWSTLATTPAASEADFRVVISNTKIVLYDAAIDHLVFDLAHGIQGDGYFGIVEHSWVSGEQACLFDFLGRPINETATPCMISATAPYGECTASITLSGYYAWKGMNCSTASGSDAWIIPADTDPVATPVWLQWFFSGASPMVPTRFEIKPRAGMSSSWYHDYNPQHIQLYGLREDETPVLIFDFELGDWDNSNMRDWDIPWPGESFYGVRLQILSTNGYGDTGGMHTAIGNFRCYGAYESP